jgi:glycosyltransferase involved in cell wall biosynthesis
MHLHRNRPLLDELAASLGSGSESRPKRVLWFTDTLTDLNGVSTTLQTVARIARRQGHEITIAACLPEDGGSGGALLEGNVVRLPFVYSFELPFYERYVLRVPSVLRAIEAIAKLDPDEIYISTPGPVGVLGMLASRLLNIRCTGIYHTDFAAQALAITGDEHLAQMLEGFTRWFYGSVDTIAVPSREYMEILDDRGHDRARMSLFRRGVDTELYVPRADARARVRKRWGLRGGAILLYAGRVSKDKNLDMLMLLHERLLLRRPDLDLVIAGDGPYLKEMESAHGGSESVLFAGRLESADLALLYAGSDTLVFPSATDTFGMVVVEALACGLPAVVSDVGGPKEIVRVGVTGAVARADDLNDWTEKVEHLLFIRETQPDAWRHMREESRRSILHIYDWNSVLRGIVGAEAQEAAPPRIPSAPPMAAGGAAILERPGA